MVDKENVRGGGRFRPSDFDGGQFELGTPRADEQAIIHDKYIHELLKNQFLPETRSAFIGIIERMHADDDIAAVFLAGTELPLLLRGAESEGVPFLDTTLIHVNAAVAAIVS